METEGEEGEDRGKKVGVGGKGGQRGRKRWGYQGELARGQFVEFVCLFVLSNKPGSDLAVAR